MAAPLQSAAGNVYGRGRRSIGVDLKAPEGVEVVRRLTDRADVFVEGFRPGVAERLGLGPDELRGRNPGLVYARMTGWGQQGPMAAKAGHDINYIGLAGPLAHIGRAGQPPTVPLNLVGDFGGGGMLMALGVAAALVERAGSGQGQVVDAAMVDGAALLSAAMAPAYQTGYFSEDRGTNLLDSGAPFYDCYATADGRWLSVGALEPAFYADLLVGLGLAGGAAWPEGAVPDRDDPASWPALRERFAATFAARPLEEWLEVVRRPGCVRRAGPPVLGGHRRSPPGGPGHLGRRRGRGATSSGARASTAPRPRSTDRPRRPATTPTRCWWRPGSRPTRSPRSVEPAPSPRPRPAPGRSPPADHLVRRLAPPPTVARPAFRPRGSPTMSTRTAAITGSASGIGAAIRARLESEGWRVIGVDLAGQEVTADLSTPEGRQAAVGDVLDAADGRLEAAVPCAGLGPQVPSRALVASVNFFGAIEVLDGLFPALQRGDVPAAVLISSNSISMTPMDDPALLDRFLAGDEPGAREAAERFDGPSVYAMSKAALARAARSRVQAWGEAGVRLNLVAPGPVRTPLLQGTKDDRRAGPVRRPAAHPPRA